MGSKFYLMNEKGERYDMNTAANGVFTSPSGFGLAYDSSYLPIGDIWVPDKRKLSQPKISGSLEFAQTPYVAFQSFMDFVNKASSIIFVYHPANLDMEYFIDVDAVSIEKGGYSRSTLEIPVTFAAKSLFYTEDEFRYEIERADKELRWDFLWETKFNDLNFVFFTYQNESHVESPFFLSFTGYCTYPVMVVYQNGAKIHEISFDLVMESADTLAMSSFDDDLFIEVNGVDRKDCLDFTNNNFFKLPQGNCEIHFTQETGKMNNIVLSMEKYYKVV